ncbi:inner membrane protein import complex subunit Tim54-domain-containing protein [Hygrophoropsis aurantiaca]|uniref:Inner membrane protein import complex subunit Tim54-domain-containing protein n=1 Tax=Hygrophoropsis aurantiaca TaxID=72124 RepID=A0ACB8ADR4_9AGAM|nr:inner membrane protein import complex subunit Tim54-domain-containing protein [Hygrophoropsis aurantiaca]
MINTTGEAATETKPLPKPKSGVRTALEYTGIPSSWLDKRPRLPSRNWLIFLTVTTSVASYYIYDRRECKRIRLSYVDRVKHLAEEPLASSAMPRKVTVYGSKWPGDEEYDRSIKYFRKYVKPILVAAAVDYELVNGRKLGDLADRIADEIKARRRVEAGIEEPPRSPVELPNQPTPEERKQRVLEGGIVIVGRPTFKEFMTGLKRGWTESMAKIDREDALAQELASDGRFDEPVDPADNIEVGSLDGEPIPTKSRLPPSALFSPIRPPPPGLTTSQPPSSIPEHLDSPPTAIPALPSLLLVPFINHVGFKQIPIMIWGFFNERHKVRVGSEAGYRLVMNQTRPFVSPDTNTSSLSEEEASSSPVSSYTQGGDLDFSSNAEQYYNKFFTPEEIEKARKGYYDSLPAKLEVARALARGTREPTKEETNNPPPTEVELRAERLKKELRWRGDLAGWDIVKPGQLVPWDDRFTDTLRVFDDPSLSIDD